MSFKIPHPVTVDNSETGLEINVEATDATNLDEESFRSDLERDSAHSSMTESKQGQGIFREFDYDKKMTSHELRYEELQRQGNLRTSMEIQRRISQHQQQTPHQQLVSCIRVLSARGRL